MAGFAATVAGFLLLRLGAFAAHMALTTTIVAGWSTTLGAITSLMGIITAYLQSASIKEIGLSIGVFYRNGTRT